MNKLKIVQGNLIHEIEVAAFDVVIHGCNCFHIMGGGIAKLIANNFPQAKEADLQTKKADINKVGKWSQSKHYYNLPVFKEAGTRLIPQPKRRVTTIINAYTQFSLSQGDDVFQYQAFDNILSKLNKEFPNATFALPWIGCGLAGGDKQKITEILEKHANNGMDLTVVQLEPVDKNDEDKEIVELNVPTPLIPKDIKAELLIKTNSSEFENTLKSMKKKPIIGCLYRHFKGGEYVVLGIGKNSETLEEEVFYQSLKDAQCWIRPIENFLEEIQFKGEWMPRFKGEWMPSFK